MEEFKSAISEEKMGSILEKLFRNRGFLSFESDLFVPLLIAAFPPDATLDTTCQCYKSVGAM